MNKKLEEQLNSMCEEMPFHIGFSYVNLHTGESFSRLGDATVPSASTRKIFILASALKDANEGRMRLDDPFPIAHDGQNIFSGVLRHFNPDVFRLSFGDALIAMIAISDNSCTTGLIKHIGIDRLNEYIRSIGCLNTKVHEGGFTLADTFEKPEIAETSLTTPNDVAHMLQLLVAGSGNEESAQRIGLTPELCARAIRILRMQVFNDRLPFHLPTGTRVAHKTGTMVNAYNDAGVIFYGRTPLFVLAVYAYDVPKTIGEMSGKYVASDLIARMSRVCYDHGIKAIAE